jgi:hypothetical protein
MTSNWGTHLQHCHKPDGRQVWEVVIRRYRGAKWGDEMRLLNESGKPAEFKTHEDARSAADANPPESTNWGMAHEWRSII